jgi:hypothetical protein
MSLTVLINLFVIAALVLGLVQLSRTGMGLSRRVLVALVVGAAVGVLFQTLYAAEPDTITATLAWSNVIGGGYVNLLRMIVMPLILVSMTAAVVRMDEAATLGKIGGLVVGLLIVTTMIAALIGIVVANIFGLSAEGLTEGAREIATAEILSERQAGLADMTLAEMLLSFIPQNIFSDLAGARPTSIIAVVVFGILLGIAGLHLTRDDPTRGAAFRSLVETAQAVVLNLVRMVISLTPYGVFALMLRVSATSNAEDILNLLSFVVASYLAIILARARVRIYVAKLGRNDTAERRNPNQRARRCGSHRQSFGLLRRHDRTEWLRRHLSGDVGRHDRADDGHQSHGPVVHRHAHRHCRNQLFRRCRHRRRRDTRGADRPACTGLPSCPRRSSDLNRATHRHGTHGAQCQRLDDGRHRHEPRARHARGCSDSAPIF